MQTAVVLQQMFIIIILVSIGYACSVKQILDGHTARHLSAIVTDISNPAIVLSTLLSGGITASHKEVILSLVTAILLYAGLCISGVIIPHIIGAKPEDRKFYNLMTVYSNTGFIGIPLAKALLPSNAMIYVIVYNVVFSLYFYTHGIIVLNGREAVRPREMANTGSVMAILSIIIYWFHISLPEVLSGTVIHIGNANVFLSMMLLGASLSKYPIKELVKGRQRWLFIGIRMILFPYGTALLLKILHLPMQMIEAFTLLTAMPAANLPLIMAEKEGYDTRSLSKGILLTTLVSFLTITLIMTTIF